MDTISDCRSRWKQAEVQIEEKIERVTVPPNRRPGTPHTANQNNEKRETHSSDNVWRRDRSGRRKVTQQEKKDAAKTANNKQQQAIAGGRKKDKPRDRRKRNTQNCRQVKPPLDAFPVHPAQSKSYAEVPTAGITHQRTARRDWHRDQDRTENTHRTHAGVRI